MIWSFELLSLFEDLFQGHFRCFGRLRLVSCASRESNSLAPSTGRVKGSNRTSGDNNCSRLLRLGSIGSCSRFSASNRTDFDSTFSATIVLVIFAYLQLGLVPPYCIAEGSPGRPRLAPSLVDAGGEPPHSLRPGVPTACGPLTR